MNSTDNRICGCKVNYDTDPKLISFSFSFLISMEPAMNLIDRFGYDDISSHNTHVLFNCIGHPPILQGGRFRRLLGTMTPPDDTDTAEIYVEVREGWSRKGNPIDTCVGTRFWMDILYSSTITVSPAVRSWLSSAWFWSIFR